ncbi:ArpU family phage packaging/lysis transcriptional regulator [Siminovitchia sp. 179-K 8D1 HS]|uniref:ArpU family phage packaging/lysis transcriptional regulator n=1 Tax=Siminovitchia sp. 179-K 8D1 HS TaxID=3142385 RepID=UPI0039A3C720
MQLSFELYSDKIQSESDMKKLEEQEMECVIEYVLGEWIRKYFRMKLIANTTKIPSITSSYSDMPFHSNGFHSSTESTALKTLTAEEWLHFFHERLIKLPEMHQEIIEKKYLKRRYDGKYTPDDLVYQEMHLGRTVYYQKKKEALYWLGLALLSRMKKIE